MVVRVIERWIQHDLRIVDHRGARPDEGVQLVPGPSDRGDPAVPDRNRLIDTAVSGHPVRAANPEHNVGQIVRHLRHGPNLARIRRDLTVHLRGRGRKGGATGCCGPQLWLMTTR